MFCVIYTSNWRPIFPSFSVSRLVGLLKSWQRYYSAINSTCVLPIYCVCLSFPKTTFYSIFSAQQSLFLLLANRWPFTLTCMYFRALFLLFFYPPLSSSLLSWEQQTRIVRANILFVSLLFLWEFGPKNSHFLWNFMNGAVIQVLPFL